MILGRNGRRYADASTGSWENYFRLFRPELEAELRGIRSSGVKIDDRRRSILEVLLDEIDSMAR
ncbi:MAG: hypothetical protein GF330_01470 [Candidatus Eisenbacteria bacterium]|nr:hypothetical protein [Candidatus Eisenbacteria bacterium]